MEGFEDNTILKTLQNLFKENCQKGEETMTKLSIFKLFFNYKIIDSCGYNIFEINDFLNQLNPEEDKITLKMFLILIFYIYKSQLLGSMLVNESVKSQNNSIQDISVQDINSLSGEQKQISSTKNIIKIIMNQRDLRKNSYNFLCPNFNKEDIQKIFQFEILDFVSKYMNSIENDIFNKYSMVDPNNNDEYFKILKKKEEELKELKLNLNTNNNNNINNSIEEKDEKEKKDDNNNIKPFRILNITKLNTLIFDYPIFKNFPCEEITQYLSLFIPEFQENNFNQIKKAFDEKMDEEQIKDIFSHISSINNTDDLNFSYSSLIILLIQFCLKLKSSEGKSFQESIDFLFENEFNLKPDQANLIEEIQEKEEEEEDYDFVPESTILNEAKQNKMGDEEAELVYDVLENLEKTLPPIDINVMSFANDKPQHANNLYLNPYKVVPAKFPLETLQVEIDERNAKNLAETEKRRIERAKKPKKRSARDPPPKEIYMEELPNLKIFNERYLGKEKIRTLTKNNVKNTFKEIVSNAKVYPSLIHESLILPKILPDKIKELIIESYKDHIHGHTEFAIRRLERAEYFLKDFKLPNEPQIELFFSLTFGSFYQELNYNITALKYYFNARKITDKFLSDNPDSALVYCYLGSLFLDMKEFVWAFRCYQYAKEWREKTIGGDTLDTSAIYNNLGVIAFYMESFLPAKNYINLAYEITRSILGLGHPRTLFIKSNLSKLGQLSFNKEVVFKTLGKYPALSQLIQNPKRAKKKKK
jgi:hypothetical protein